MIDAVEFLSILSFVENFFTSLLLTLFHFIQFVILGDGFRAEKRSAQASAHPLSQAQGGNFLCVDCVCLLLEF